VTKPETLKAIAEAMGYSVYIDEYHSVKIHGTPTKISYPFNPETNPAQLMEVIKWLIDSGWKLGKEDDEYYFFSKSINYLGSKSFEQAIMQAAAIVSLELDTTRQVNQ
jgi:hypothetical protein